jgi:hypothetical protein
LKKSTAWENTRSDPAKDILRNLAEPLFGCIIDTDGDRSHGFYLDSLNF